MKHRTVKLQVLSAFLHLHFSCLINILLITTIPGPLLKDSAYASTFPEYTKTGNVEDIKLYCLLNAQRARCHQNVIAAFAQFSTIVQFLLSIFQLSNKNNLSNSFLVTVSNVIFLYHLRLKLNLYGVEIL